MLASSNELTKKKVNDVSSKVGRRRVRVRVLQSKMRPVDAAVSSQTHQSLSNGAPPSQSALIVPTARERKKDGAACELARLTLQTAVSVDLARIKAARPTRSRRAINHKQGSSEGKGGGGGGVRERDLPRKYGPPQPRRLFSPRTPLPAPCTPAPDRPPSA